MYIAPNSVVYLLRGVPLNKKYVHSVAYKTSGEQLNAFLKYKYKTATVLQYVRESGSIKLNYNSDDVKGCNYMVFTNTPYTNKYYYAFIDEVKYVGNNACEVFFTVDYLQTYINDFHFLDSYVEREHVNNDHYGENLVPEPFGDMPLFYYKLDVDNAPFDYGKSKVVVIRGTEQSDCVVSNTFSGLDYIFFKSAQEAKEYLRKINSEAEASEVVAVYQVPNLFIDSAGFRDDFNTGAPILVGISGGGLVNLIGTPFGGYNPKNMKLYTSQFFGLQCESSSGASKKYALEHFNDPNNPMFGIEYAIANTPICSLVPNKYMGSAGVNIIEELLCTDFPMCAWTSNSFREYMALHAGSLITGGFDTATNLTTGLVTADPSSLLKSGKGAFGFAGRMRDLSAMPNKVRAGSGSALSYARGTTGYTFYRYSVREDMARIIDDFFTQFGYQVNTIKKPNFYNRMNFTYIKTRGCSIKPNADYIPCNAIDKICEIFDSGITMWRNMDLVGDYSVDNYPVIEGDSNE